MNVYRVWTNMKNSMGNAIFWNVITTETIESLTERLNAGGMAVVERIYTRKSKDEEGFCLEVISRKQAAISHHMVNAIEQPTERFVQFTEEAQA